jgi:hypothetical protein
MSLDAPARAAGSRLRAAAGAVDTERALERVTGLSASRRTRLPAWGWAVTVAAALLLVAWLVGPAASVLKGEPVEPARPVGPEVVGARLPVPVSMPVPRGWHVEHDDGFVVLAPDVVQPSTVLYVGVPTRVYDSATGLHEAGDLHGSLLQWTLDNTYLRAVDRRTVQVDGVTGQAMGLELAPAFASYEESYLLSLVVLKDQTSVETVHFGSAFKTFEWAVIPVGSQEVLVVATSPFAHDPAAEQAFTDVLDTIRFEPGSPS